MLKEEQRKAVLDLLGQKDVAAVLATGFFIFLSRALASLASSLMFLKRTNRKMKQRLFTGYKHSKGVLYQWPE